MCAFVCKYGRGAYRSHGSPRRYRTHVGMLTAPLAVPTRQTGIG
jgi:hypothetical protein